MDTRDDLGLAAREMSPGAVDAFLTEQGYGVLSLAAADEAYGIPISFGYNDEQLYFILHRTRPTSRKVDFVDRTDLASFLVVEVTSKHDWRSVVARGPLYEVPEEDWDELMTALGESAWFPSLFSAAEPVQGFLGYTLRIEEITGLAGPDAV